MFAIDTLQDNRKEKGTRGVTKAISRLIRLKAPLIVLELPDQSLSFANVYVLAIDFVGNW